MLPNIAIQIRFSGIDVDRFFRPADHGEEEKTILQITNPKLEEKNENKSRNANTKVKCKKQMQNQQQMQNKSQPRIKYPQFETNTKTNKTKHNYKKSCPHNVAGLFCVN